MEVDTNPPSGNIRITAEEMADLCLKAAQEKGLVSKEAKAGTPFVRPAGCFKRHYYFHPQDEIEIAWDVGCY